MEGIFAYTHHPDVIKEGEHIIDLPRTVLRSKRVGCSYLGVWRGQTELSLYRDSDFARPRCGTLRLRRK